MNTDEFKVYAEMLKDEETRNSLIQMANEMKEDIYPLLTLAKEILGNDLDGFIDDIIKWSAKKSFVAYVAYQAAGFSKIEAMQLTLNMREDVANAIRHAKAS